MQPWPALLVELSRPPTVEGEKFEGSDDDWNAYIRSVLPTAEDEEALKEYFKLEWIENKPLTARQLESGIGATA